MEFGGILLHGVWCLVLFNGVQGYLLPWNGV